jgi:exopolysaccharide biosynthesis predicted pyruvyltransferase EpsI
MPGSMQTLPADLRASGPRRIDVWMIESREDGPVRRHIRWHPNYDSRVLTGSSSTMAFDAETVLVPLERMESAALALVFAAMLDDAALVLHGAASPRFLSNLIEFQRAWACWRPDRYRLVTISAEEVVAMPAPGAATLAAFSGGLDSAFTMRRHGRAPGGAVAGLLVHGFDILLAEAAGFALAHARAETMMASVGRPLVTAATDIRGACRVDWEDSHGAFLGMVGHQLGAGFDRFLIPGSTQYDRMMLPWGSNPVTDPMMSSESLQIAQDGVECARIEKLAALRDWPEALANLRVCWERARRGSNCGRCEKCVETWLGFRHLGFDPASCFPEPPTADAIRALRIRSVSDAIEGWKFLSDAGLVDPLHQALRGALVRFERNLEPTAGRQLRAMDVVLPARTEIRAVTNRKVHEPFAAVTARFTECLDRILGERFALLDWPNHRNVGDHMIWLGEKIALRRYLGGDIVLEGSASDRVLAAVRELPTDVALVLHGGGNFGDLYPRHQHFREEIIRRFPDRVIVMMPQSLCFQDEAGLERCLALYDAHPALTVFIRDRASLERIRASTADRRYVLAPDAALFLGEVMPSLLDMAPPVARAEIVQLLRDDVEVHRDRPAPSPDWPCLDWLRRRNAPDPAYAERARTALARLGLAEWLSSDLDRKSWEHLHYGMSILAQGRRVVTDRLHGHILALLMGKPHTLFDTNNGKIRAFHKTWSHGNALVHMPDLAPGG